MNIIIYQYFKALHIRSVGRHANRDINWNHISNVFMAVGIREHAIRVEKGANKTNHEIKFPNFPAFRRTLLAD